MLYRYIFTNACVSYLLVIHKCAYRKKSSSAARVNSSTNSYLDLSHVGEVKETEITDPYKSYDVYSQHEI